LATFVADGARAVAGAASSEIVSVGSRDADAAAGVETGAGWSAGFGPFCPSAPVAPWGPCEPSAPFEGFEPFLGTTIGGSAAPWKLTWSVSAGR